MDNVKFTIVKNWLMGKNGNDYWTYTKYYDVQKRKCPLCLCNMEAFLDGPFDADGNSISKNELIWLMADSKDFNIHDVFAYYKDGELKSASTVFPNLLNAYTVAQFIMETNNDLENDELHEILKRI